MDDIRAVMMDLDGTIYEGDHLVDGSYDVIMWFRERNIKVFYSTNNSEKSRKEVCEKLQRLGIPCHREDVVSSGFTSAAYVNRLSLKAVYVCGTDGLKSEFQEQEVDLVENPYDAENTVIGMDSRFDYHKLTMAVRAALQSEYIIACNQDRVFPKEGGELFPGCGAMVSSVEYCANRTVDLVIGKPNTIMLEHIMKSLSLEKDEILVIGDSLESDIEMAKAAGAPYIYINDDRKEGGFPMNTVLDLITVTDNL